MGMPITNVTEEEIKNRKIREWFRNAEKMEDTWHRRQSLLIGMITRLGSSMCTLKKLTRNTAGDRRRGRPFCTITDAFVGNLKETIKILCARGSAHDCIVHVKAIEECRRA